MKQKKIICLGDSLTEGYPFFGEQSWVSLLNKKGIGHFINKGICGQTSTQITARMEADVLDCKPDFLFLLMGTNDFLFTNATPEDVLEQISIIALTARQHDISPVLFIPMLTIPEMASRAWEEDIDYAQVNRCLIQLRKLLIGLSAASHLPCIDLQSSFLALIAGEAASTYYIDGLHPTKLGYEVIAEIIEKFAKNTFLFLPTVV